MTDERSPYQEGALGGPGKWSQERLDKKSQYKEQILEGIASGLFISEICENLEIDSGTVRKWRKEDRPFDEKYSDAESSFMDTMEKEAIRRAKHGVLEPVVSKGEVVFWTNPETGNKEMLQQRKYSDGLMMFILRGRRRDIYGEKREIDATHKFDVTGAKSELERKFASAIAPVLTSGSRENDGE